MRIGEYIKALREQRKWTLRDLGAAAGNLSIGFISDIERGRSDPSLTTLHRIAKAFDLGAGDLLVGAGYTVRPIALDVLADRTVKITLRYNGKLISHEVEEVKP